MKIQIEWKFKERSKNIKSSKNNKDLEKCYISNENFKSSSKGE